MKFLKKASLAAVVAAAPFAVNAEMVALDDATMSTTTGQAGVTIELDARIGIDKVTYTDEGKVVINNIQIGGSLDANGAVDSAITGLKQDIDVVDNGGLAIKVGSVSGAPINMAMTVGNVNLVSSDDSASSTLIDSMSLTAVLGPQYIAVHNGQNDVTVGSGVLSETFTAAAAAGANTSISMKAGLKITDLDVKASLGTGNVDLENITFTNPNDPLGQGLAYVSQKIYADSKGLVIEAGQLAGDLTVGAVRLGDGGTGVNDSIGSIAISNLELAGTTMTIYGH